MTIQTDTARMPIGNFTILSNKQDRMSNYVRSGRFEEWMKPLIDSYADKDKIAIDMGSNLGIHTAYMSNKFQHVLAFEPQSVIADLSRQTFKDNGFQNITVIDAGCSDVKGVIDFPVIDYDTTKNCGSASAEGASRQYSSGWDGESYTSVDVVSVDDIFFDMFSHGAVGFVKVDVEGYEYKALKGAEKILKTFQCPVIIELKDRPLGNIRRVHDLFISAGYGNRRMVGQQNWDYLYTK